MHVEWAAAEVTVVTAAGDIAAVKGAITRGAAKLPALALKATKQKPRFSALFLNWLPPILALSIVIAEQRQSYRAAKDLAERMAARRRQVDDDTYAWQRQPREEAR